MSAAVTIIVGSGVAGVAVARRLLQRDAESRVIMLEAGGEFPVADYRKWLDFVMTRVSPTRAFEDAKGDADINQDGGFGLVGGRLLVRGGSTNHWGGWCPRMKPEDFHLGAVRKKSLNWPLTYIDIAKYYTQAEELLDVCGNSESTLVPRFGERYPHPPVPYTALDQLLIPTLSALNYAYEPLPIARNPSLCHTTGTCRYCPFDARYAAASDLNKLLSQYSGRVTLRDNSPVVAIQMRDRKTAVGVTVFDKASDKTVFVEGDRVIVAGGTIESAKLLLTSRSAAWPNGIGNDADHVGRHLVTHPLLRAIGQIDSNKGRLEQEIDFPTLACRHFDSEECQPEGKMYFVRDGKYIVVSIADKLLKKESPAQIKQGIETGTRIELRALVEAFPAEDNRVTVANGNTRLGLSRTQIQYREAPETIQARIKHQKALEDLLYRAGLKESPPLGSGGARADHATGTCRMSKSPADGVVDPNLRVHETDNVFVCSNATFPNAGAVNPTLTLVALSLRLGDYLSSTA